MPLLNCIVSVGVSRWYTDHYQGRCQCQGHLAISLKFMWLLYNVFWVLRAIQLTTDHWPVCKCHCIFPGINPRVMLSHDFVIIARQFLEPHFVRAIINCLLFKFLLWCNLFTQLSGRSKISQIAVGRGHKLYNLVNFSKKTAWIWKKIWADIGAHYVYPSLIPQPVYSTNRKSNSTLICQFFQKF